jgi:hypothetical protein
MNLLTKVALMFGIAIFANISNAKQVVAKGEYLFGPQMSEAEACEVAEIRAKENALKQTYGEQFSADSNLICDDSNKDVKNACRIERHLLSTIDGEIDQIIEIDQRIEKRYGVTACIVTITARISNNNSLINSKNHFSASLNRSIYRQGESLELTIEPTKPIYLVIFSFCPEVDGELVKRIFPNDFDRNNFIKSKTILPKQDNRVIRQYRWTLKWQAMVVDTSKPAVIEYLIIISTNHEEKWLDEYRLKDLRLLLSKISPQDKYFSKLSYRVIR